MTSSSSSSCVPVVPNMDIIQKELGHGPARFVVTKQERSIQEQIDSLSMEERMCFHNLKVKWEEEPSNVPFHDEWYLRFARCSPGGMEKYNEKSAWNVMLKFNRRYDTLRCSHIEKQLYTKTIFPIPALKSLHGEYDFFYMRPSRYFPKIVPTETMLDNLVYVINTMVENSEKSCTEGIGMIINMKQWKKNENYSTHYFYQLIQILQGAVPVRIRLCLILNAPKWFVKIWLFMKQMLTKELREKVIFLGSADLLHQYLQDGYEQYVPDELLLDENDSTTLVAISTKSAATGVNTDDMVNDFIKYRKYVEMIRYGNPSNENQSNQKLATTDVTTSHSTKRVWTESPIRVEALFAVPTGEQVEL